MKDTEDTTDDEDDFQDAVTEPQYEELQVSCPPVHRRTVSSVSAGSCEDGPVEAEGEAETDYSSDQDDPNIRTFVKKKAKRMNSVGKKSSASTPVKKVCQHDKQIYHHCIDLSPGYRQTKTDEDS